MDTRAYDAGGRLVTTTLGNGISEIRTYNTDNTLNTIAFSNSDLGSYSYTWDVNKNKTAETITGPLVSYSFTTAPGATSNDGYDAEDRLINYNRGTLSQAWNLSPEGDWNTFTENGTVQTRTHGPAHEVTNVASVAVTHDVKGNITKKTSSLSPTDTSTLTWDFDSRLTSVDTNTNGNLDASYTYDALGRRATKNNTVFVCLGQQVLSEYQLGTPAASPTEQYAYATYIDEPVIKDGTGGLGAPAGGITYYHRNQQYSIIGLTNSAGNIAEHYAYDAYGRTTLLDSNLSVFAKSDYSNGFMFTGRRLDEETGDCFFRARYYDSDMGRFLRRDPLEYVDGRSLYRAYFVPTRLDPTGLNLIDLTSSGCYDYCTAQGGSPEYCSDLCASRPVTGGAHPDFAVWGNEVDRWDNGGKPTFVLPKPNDPNDRCQCKDSRFWIFKKPNNGGIPSLVRPTVGDVNSGIGVTIRDCQIGQHVTLRYAGICVDSQDAKCECKKSCSVYTTWKCARRPKIIQPYQVGTRWVVAGRHFYSKCK